MTDLSLLVAAYVADSKKLDKLNSSTETTFYPAIRTVLTEVLKAQRLPFEVRTGTAETKPGGVNMPDFVLGDSAGFVGVYPVLKKWLGYRQANRRSDMSLTDDEWRWFRSIVQRVAALLAVGPSLDALYQEAASDAFTVTDLGITR